MRTRTRVLCGDLELLHAMWDEFMGVRHKPVDMFSESHGQKEECVHWHITEHGSEMSRS